MGNSSRKTDDATSLKRRFSRRYQIDLVLEGCLVGLMGGGVVTLYRLSLSYAEKALRYFTGAALGKPVLMLLWFVFLAFLVVIVGKLVTWEPATSGSGIPQVDAEVIGHMDMPWHRVLAAKFIEGTACALGGLSLGREGPSVQLGGMAGKAVSKLLKRRRGEERLLVTCGAAAGMSAAFHAPLTGVLFALEEIHKEFTASLIISVMASSLVADYLVSGVLGVAPVLHLAFSGDLPHSSYLLLIIFGIACGLIGAVHNRGMFTMQGLYNRIQKGVPYLRYTIPFALAGIVAFTWPELMCGGDAIAEILMDPAKGTMTLMVALLVGKYLFTSISFGSGAPGGTLFPLVIMGGLVGAVFAFAGIQAGFITPEYYKNFLVLGIAGLFASVVRAPVTGVVLAFELTGSLDAMLSVSLVSIISYLTANLTKTDPFYEHLLAKQLGVAEGDEALSGMPTGKVLKGFSISTGSALEGKLIKDIPWPDGTRIVMIKRAASELIPQGDTKLEALDELLFIMNADAEDDATLKLDVMTRQPVSFR